MWAEKENPSETYGTIPTEAEIIAAGYDTTHNVVLCVHFTGEAIICNEIVFVGSYNNWDIDNTSAMEHFTPLANYDRWYVMQVPYSSGATGGPAVLNSDGTFNWDNRGGGIDAWTHKGGKIAELTDGFNEDAAYLGFVKGAGAYIYEVTRWKKHINPCSDVYNSSSVQDTTATTATIEWIPDTTVTQYTVSVYTIDTLFAQYIVDGAGNVIDTLKAAPKIAQMPKKKLDSRETFTISIGGLTPGSSYTYTIVGTNIEQQPVYYEEGSFQTADEGKGIDVISSDPDKPRKILYEGKIYILRNGKTYDLLGR